MKSTEIRDRFVGYFERRGHLHVPSGPLVPADDPTLMFTNAGMVQFKRVFQGEVEPPGDRAVTVQKCLRVSGKHNDLEEVGRTARHHTFFEMLGNFSFGDYFKRDAIAYAWEFLVEDLGMDPDRLWATVHHSDDEAYDLWLELTPLGEDRVRRLGDKDNFWQMGDTGPCGPCSEVHYDLRSAPGTSLTDEQFMEAGEADQFLEIWNLVFMQFDRTPDGTDHALPAPSIDTGAGLERIAAILQNERTNFHTDLFLPLIEEAEARLGIPYSRDPSDWEAGLPFRVLADHARAVAFLLADGVFPSNEKRGYVLRRVLRRAVRYYWLLGRHEPLLHHLVSRVVDTMSPVYPELEARREHLEATARAEEERFLSTIDEGMSRFDDIAPPGGEGTIPGADAFRLYDTFGFPLDLTALIARERGYDVDMAGFEEALTSQRERSRAAADTAEGGGTDSPSWAVELTDGEQRFVGYERCGAETAVLGWSASEDGTWHAFRLARNPFYLESGGQVSDRGRLLGSGWEVRVDRLTAAADGATIVIGELVAGELTDAPATLQAEVDAAARADTERNHTATHLLHAALRERLGDHVQQAGSLVAPDRLRFDFSHRGPLTPGERADVERRVNEVVLENLPVEIGERGYREAIAAGAMALFGEKYGDVVRTVSVPGVSLELCGGTHVRSTGQIGLFRIVSESGVAAGIRRIEAITGHAAYESVVRRETTLQGLSMRLGVPEADVPGKVDRLLADLERLASEVAEQSGEAAAGLVEGLIERADGESGRWLAGRLELPSGSDFGVVADLLRDRFPSGAAIVHVAIPGDDREAFIAVVSDDLIRQGLKAGDLVRVSSRATGSGGGGRPHFAQGGVGDRGSVDEALASARAFAVERVPELAG